MPSMELRYLTLFKKKTPPPAPTGSEESIEASDASTTTP